MEPNQAQFQRITEINKDTVKAQEIMSPEEKDMSKERESSAFYYEIEKRVAREIEEMRPEVKSKLGRVIRADVLDDHMVNSVLHELKKLRELSLANRLTPESYDVSPRSLSHRGVEAFRSLGFRNIVDSATNVSGEEIESIKNTVDVDRYSKIVVANLNLINAISSGDSVKIEELLKQTEVFSQSFVENFKERIGIVQGMLIKWMDSKIFLEKTHGRVSFSGSTDEEKLEFISEVVNKECFNFYTEAEGESELYCMNCGRVPEGFGVNW
jgi:hypothetical protein